MSNKIFYIHYNKSKFLANKLNVDLKYSKQYIRQQIDQKLFLADNNQAYFLLKKSKFNQNLNTAFCFKNSVNVIKHKKNIKMLINTFYYKKDLNKKAFLLQNKTMLLAKKKKFFGKLAFCNKGGAVIRLTKNIQTFIPKTHLKKNYLIQQKKKNKFFFNKNKQFFYFQTHTHLLKNKLFFILSKISYNNFSNFLSMKTKKRKFIKAIKNFRNLNAIALYKQKLNWKKHKKI